MRWDLLFDDLESQLDQEQRDEERALALEEERLRLGRLTLRDRLTSMARIGPDDGSAGIRIELRDGQVLDTRPLAFGRLAVISSCRRQRIHPLKESRKALFVGATAFSIRRFDKAILDLLSLRTEWVHQG